MPGPLDYLTTPLVPKGVVAPAQEALDSPTLERGPWEARLRGFGAGALEGLRNQTSPANLLSMLPVARVGRLMGRGAQAIGGVVDDVAPAVSGLKRLGDMVPEYAPVDAPAFPSPNRQMMDEAYNKYINKFVQ